MSPRPWRLARKPDPHTLPRELNPSAVRQRTEQHKKRRRAGGFTAPDRPETCRRPERSHAASNDRGKYIRQAARQAPRDRRARYRQRRVEGGNRSATSAPGSRAVAARNCGQVQTAVTGTTGSPSSPAVRVGDPRAADPRPRLTGTGRPATRKSRTRWPRSHVLRPSFSAQAGHGSTGGGQARAARGRFPAGRAAISSSHAACGWRSGRHAST